MITEDLQTYGGDETIDELVEAANGHRVVVLLYPHNKGIKSPIYTELAEKTNGKTLFVDNDVMDNEIQSPNSRKELSQALRDANIGTIQETVGQLI